MVASKQVVGAVREDVPYVQGMYKFRGGMTILKKKVTEEHGIQEVGSRLWIQNGME